MPPANVGRGSGRRRVALDTGIAAPAILNIQRQLEGLKRQIARGGDGANGKPTGQDSLAKPADERQKASSDAPVRLRKASGVAARRLGVPLRGDDPAMLRVKRLRVDGLMAVKQQLPSDEEDGHATWAPPVQTNGVAHSNRGRTRPAVGNGIVKARKLCMLPNRGGQENARTRNIVGTLISHLTAAKRNFSEEDKGRAVKPRRRAVLGAAKPRMVTRMGRGRGRLDVREVTKQQTEERQKEEEAKQQATDTSIGEKEMVLLQGRLEGHYAMMKNFIRTRAEPTIFYLPVKHTPETEESLNETRVALEQKILSLKVHLRTGQEIEDEVVEVEDEEDEQIEDSAGSEDAEDADEQSSDEVVNV